MFWPQQKSYTPAVSVLLVSLANAYLLGDDSQLCWIDGVIADCTGVEGITVEWIEKPPNSLMTSDEATVSCSVDFDQTGTSTVVPKTTGGSLVDHINIHSCNDNVVLCIPAVSPDVATHSPAKNGHAGTYEHILKLPNAGVWTTICHARIYSNMTGTLRKIDAAVAHFGITVSEPPLPPPDHTVTIASASASSGAILMLVAGALIVFFMMRKNDIMIEYTDLQYEKDKPWRVTRTSAVFKGSYKGIPIAIKKVKHKGSRTQESPNRSVQNRKLSTRMATVKINKDNKVFPTLSPSSGAGKVATMSMNSTNGGSENPLKALKREMKILNRLKHPKIVQFIGVAHNKNFYYICTEFMAQGSLYEVIGNACIGLNFEQKLHISHDTVNGLFYMHSVGLLHGDIKSLNIFMSADMRAKIGDFGSTAKIGAKKSTGTLAWMAPELLLGQSFNTKASDIYALGMTLWETWTCRGLYRDFEMLTDDKYNEAIQNDVIAGKRPPILKSDSISHEITSIIEKCWAEDVTKRPSALELDNELQTLLTSTDFMAANDEKKDEKAIDLLYKVLPPKIAEQIRHGQKVDPIHKDCVTVLFSDIVGFTDISSKLSSEDVMEMLSRLYDKFDAITTKYELFKVETIGDAYMVAGGLFDNEGVQAEMICRQGLDMIHAAASIPVHKDHPELGNIKIRVGAHTGPVVASVVGSLNPRFCLFGDTVNSASRMESNSIVQRFQISSETKSRLAIEAPEFNIQLRGKIPIKGKGNLWTYWVEGLNSTGPTLSSFFPPPPDPVLDKK